MSDAAVDTSSEITTKVRLDAARLPFGVRAPLLPERCLARRTRFCPEPAVTPAGLLRSPPAPGLGHQVAHSLCACGEGAGSAVGKRGMAIRSDLRALRDPVM